MLEVMCEEKSLRAHGIVGIYPAYSDNDDIKVLSEDRSKILMTFHGLRQQV